MRKEIIVDASELESRVAILEDGEPAELLVEREPRMVGSIYKARVVSVLPGMDAAFADVGLDRNVFLSQDDVGLVSGDGVTVSPAPRSASIAQRLKENQEVVVQIVRAPVGGKGARASTRLALPGRYLVLLVSHGFQVGVSRKLEDRKERDRLRKIGERIRPEDAGVIVRTEAEGHKQRDLEADLKVLLDLRDRLMEAAANARAPALIHRDLTLTYQVIRDVFSDDVKALILNEKGAYDNAVELVKLIAPHLRRRIKLYRKRMPIFQEHGIEDEIDRLLRRKVWLPSGGYISIDQAEAFTAIDVNTGRFTGSKGLADTILRTNLEAATEIARQLRLRDIGGIIVVDFIDMDRARHRQRVKRAFEDALKRDRQKTKILHLSALGLVEMTRKRRGESLMGILTEACPHCGGLGRVRRPLTVALRTQRELARLAAEDGTQAVVVRAAPAVADILIGDDGEPAARLEKALGGPLYIRADARLGTEEHQVALMSGADAAAAVTIYEKGSEVTLDTVDPPEPGGDGRVLGWTGGYRVLVEGPQPKDDEPIVLLTQAGHSFGRGHVKGAHAPDGGAEPQAKESSRRARRRRRPKRKSADKPAAAAEAASDADAKAGAELSVEQEVKEEAEAKRPARTTRRRRRPKRKSAEKSAAAAEAALDADAKAGAELPVEQEVKEEAEAKRPARSTHRRRRPRRKSAQKSAGAAGAASAGTDESAGEAASQATSARAGDPAAAEAAQGPASDEVQPARKRSGLLTRGSRRRKRSLR